MPRGIHKKMYDGVITESSEVPTLSAEPKPFKITPYMEKWLEFAMKSESDDIAVIARECGMDRNNWYLWLKIPGFIDWYTKTWQDRLRAVGPKLDMIGIMNSKKDYRYWEAMQRRVGNLSMNNSTNVAVQVNAPTIVDSNGETLNL